MLRLRAIGRTVDEIGAQIGKTKNAVAAKLYELRKVGVLIPVGRRLGASRRRRSAAPKLGTETRSNARNRLAPTPPEPRFELRAEPTSRIDLESEPTPSTAIGILSLTDATCRWPLWSNSQREYLFCGEATALASHYCERHRTRSVRKVAIQ